MNDTITTFDDVYYFAYPCVSTTEDSDGELEPDPEITEGMFLKTATYMSKYTGTTAGGFTIDESWQPNDGLVNTISAGAPLGQPSTDYTEEKAISPGVWNVMPTITGDHMSLQGGMTKRNNVRPFYLVLAEMIAELDRQNEMKFKEANMERNNMEVIYLAGGCFWGVEKFLDQFEGVISTEVGYANGPDTEVSYRDVCNGSGHAETVKVIYDKSRITLSEILDYYFMVIDPVSVNKQGNDIGIQYRTGIYYEDEELLPEITKVYEEQEKNAGQKLAVEVETLKNFYTAEDYHQKYLDNNPGGYCHIPRKMFKLEEERKKEEAKELRDRIGDLSYEVTQ
ncbi:MAG: peptide-methionine (S)-S-oxide reductase MsrA, partial [Lachnospiraceae bacterium]|nr:peptide-methionine (S)-S-oxide reductase MsrA [Lachnospiraceae bacterium]